MEKSKYVITEPYNDKSIELDWTFIPEAFLEIITKDLYNIKSISSDGDIREKTVVFIRPVDNFSGNVDTVELSDIIIGKEILS